MSQRIQDIIKTYPQKTVGWTDGGYTPLKETDIEGIAEFIVNECIGIAMRSSHRDDDMGAIIARYIKKEML
jgi:hypothetical protein